MRVGHGYDVHKFAEGRKLILGGVQIEYERGLLGHSDADVLTHAVMDALLGAASLGDIGRHFSDSDKQYKDVSSLVLLSKVCEKIYDKGFKICNIDSTIIAQEPKLSPFIEIMRQNLAYVCNIDIERVNIKATTEEGLGFSGKKEGIAAHAICLLE